jgi:hypothetical protein
MKKVIVTRIKFVKMESLNTGSNDLEDRQETIL